MKKFISSVLVLTSLIVATCQSTEAQEIQTRRFDGAKNVTAVAVDQVHFSIMSGTAVTFDWIGTTDSISYGTDANNLNLLVRAKPSAYLPVTSPWVSDPGPYWEAKLTGLQQNAMYYYKIGSAGKVNSFRAPPPAGASGFRICTTSDMHSNSPECVSMFGQIAEFKPALVITTGDVTGAGPDGQNRVTARFHDAMAWSLSAAWMIVEGNHDWEYTNADDLRTLKGRFDIPNPGMILSSPAVSAGGEDWGWFDYGNTRFISCPEPWTSGTRNEWKTFVTPVFAAAQNDPNIKFIVTFGHRSAYTSASGRYPGDTSLRTLLDGFHVTYPKYVLDLSGHNHQYERYQLPSGMTYIINSTTGSYYRGWNSSTKPSNCNFRAIHYSILVLDVSDNTIQGQLVCSANTTNPGGDYKPREEPVCSTPGAILDAFTVTASQGVTAVRGIENQVPSTFSITNYPNPFNPSTRISYTVPRNAHVKILIHDMLGRVVATPVDKVKEAGTHSIEWSAKDEHSRALASGMYIAQLQSGAVVTSTKMLLVR